MGTSIIGLPEKFRPIYVRCKDAGISVEYSEFEAELIDGVYEGVSVEYLSIDLSATESPKYLIVDEEDLEQLESIQFEDYRFIDGYYAFYSPSMRTIEAVVEPTNRRNSHLLLRRLSSAIGRDPSEIQRLFKNPEEFEPITVKKGDSSITISLGLASEPSATLLELVRGWYFSPTRLRRLLTLQITGVTVNDHSVAKRLLEEIGASFLFQIDTTTDVSLYFPRAGENRIRRRRAIRNREVVELQFPGWTYDKHPLLLYWYAKSANDMPLQQFLAFYQVLEFYFPTYALTEAVRIARSKLKNPGFNVSSDPNVADLVKAIGHSSRGGFGNEQDQLQSVIQQCVRTEDLYQFLTEQDDLVKFYKEKKQFGKLSNVKIPLNESSHDLLQIAAKRIYELRCRIVHSKGEQSEEKSPILPFSEEEELLTHDITLVQYIAKQAIINSSSSLR
ncbi:MAG: hypothetical protein IIC84_06345 [Chloroflexi bacterium]|nr:hypothetical protein [Chloroflexota bacterium]